MVIGVLTARLAIYGATSLKDKRRVVKGIKDQVHHKFNVSIAEIDALDSRQSAVLGAAVVSNDGRFAEACLGQVINLIRSRRGATLLDYTLEKL